MKYLIIFSLLLISITANANHHCVGKVNKIDIAGTSNLHANIEGMGVGNVICSLSQTLGNYNPESCKAVLSLLMTTKISGKHIRLYFNNDNNTSCNKGNWIKFADHGLYYVRLED